MLDNGRGQNMNKKKLSSVVFYKTLAKRDKLKGSMI